MSLIEVYPGALGLERTFVKQDLYDLLRVQVKKDIETEEDLSEYYRKYTEITHYLIGQQKITSDDFDSYILEGLDPKLRQEVLLNLKFHFGIHHHDDPWPLDYVMQELKFLMDDRFKTTRSKANQEPNLVSMQMAMMVRIEEVVSDGEEEEEVWVSWEELELQDPNLEYALALNEKDKPQRSGTLGFHYRAVADIPGIKKKILNMVLNMLVLVTLRDLITLKPVQRAVQEYTAVKRVSAEGTATSALAAVKIEGGGEGDVKVEQGTEDVQVVSVECEGDEPKIQRLSTMPLTFVPIEVACQEIAKVLRLPIEKDGSITMELANKGREATEGIDKCPMFQAFKYKPVAKKVCPVVTETPAEFRVERRMIGDLLADLLQLPVHLPKWELGTRLMKERGEKFDWDPGGFLWPKELKLIKWLIQAHEMAFTWDATIYSDIIKIIKEKIVVGVYEPSTSSYRSRWFCVVKDGKLLCLIHDLQPLNAVLIQDLAVPLHVDSIMEAFTGHAVFGMYDLMDVLADEIAHGDETPEVTMPFIDDIPVKGLKMCYLKEDGTYETIEGNPGI
ncbi:hypothetical protein BKA83DRAFT_4489486 [Pisolithus microcarpus]|nr:hypothetical protein BKA83DRAFT_4489486 [Pisolithus microcarpus]